MAKTPRITVADSIAALSKVSGTSIQLPTSYINIGGIAYVNPSAIVCALTTVGANGIDTGVLQANKLYYVYGVVVAGVLKVVASLNSASPTGFTTYKLLGYFDTNGSSQVLTVSNKIQGATGEYRHAHMTEAQFQAVAGPGWILADGRNVAGSAWSITTGNSAAPDARGIHLRGKDNGRGQNPDGDLALGTYQDHSYLSHNHGGTGTVSADHGHNELFDLNPNGNHGDNPIGNYYVVGGNRGTGGIDTNHTHATGTVGGNETRGRNITANIFIRIN